jgi:L-ascorbate metabolism protein UlaG (beta-lactamase superfamily)
MRVVHLGDLGHLLGDEQLRQIGTPDVVMIPVGGYYTIDAVSAKQVADSLGAKIVLPMHYRGESFGYDVIGTVDEFTKLYSPKMVKRYESNSIEVDDDTAPQVAVLKFLS